MQKSFYYIILIFVFSIIVGYFYSMQWKKNHVALDAEQNKIVEETAYQEEKLGSGSEFAIKKYYNMCGHTKILYAEMPSELINMTKNDVKRNYPEWDIDQFSNSKLILSKEIEGLCDEHYVIKIDDEFINIYHQTQSNDVELYRQTNINKDYLTEEDIEKLYSGIYVYGRDKLNSLIEDYE